MSRDDETTTAAVNRRQFVQYSAAGMLLGAAQMPWLLTGAEAASNQKPKNKPRTEVRTYLFNLRHLDTSSHDLILVAGQQRVKLKRVTSGALRKARQGHPVLNHVPDHHFTHHLTVDLPADALQLCYLQRVQRGRKDGAWHMVMLFTHHPVSALTHAHRRALLGAEQGVHGVHVKWQRYGISRAMRVALNDPVGEAMLQDTTDHATSMVAAHPELTCGEPNSAAHIQNNIIGTQPTTDALGGVLESLGDNWATMTPLVDDETGLPFRNSCGDIQCVPEWSLPAASFAGQAMTPALDTTKNDTSLGVNISGLDPTEIEDNDDTAATNGAIWALQDGMATVDQTATALLGATELGYKFSNQTPGHGYAVNVHDVSAGGDGRITLHFKAKNNYVRYLSLYVRYLDGNENPLRLADIESEIRSGFRNWDLNQNGQHDAYLEILNPQWNFFGIPIKTTTQTYSLPVPTEAASICILGGGLGTGSNAFPDTTPPGVIMTAMYNLAIPSLMLSLGAAAGYAKLSGSLQNPGLLASIIPLIVQLFADIATDLSYNDPEVFNSLVAGWAAVLLKQAAGPLLTPVADAIAEGLAIQAVTDAIPFAGIAMSALVASGLVAEIVRTSVNVANSPRVYIDKVKLTHNIDVTISHDPENPAGFPAVADHIIVTALFNDGSPQTRRYDLPGTTVTDSITVSFVDVPAGGLVQVKVGIYAANEWVAGHGESEILANSAAETTLDVPVTITENLVPLDAATQYSHKERIVLDSSDNHIWHADTIAPTVVRPQGQCDNVNGHLCALTNITVSTTTASVGYSWRAYNTAVRDCTSGGLSQLYQFGNVSSTQNPQSGYLFSDCGFSGVSRIMYDLLGRDQWNFYLDPSNGNNFIRQIRLSPGGASDYDSPVSNRAFGRLQFPSDALLLHPMGKIISLNTTLHKLEVLDLAPQAVSDDAAPLSAVRSGVGTREGLMDGPIHAAMTAQGAILVLEQNNNRIQAFDIGGNSVPYFDDDAYYVPLRDPAGTATYLDLAVEYSGYLYVLSYTGSGPFVYRLDIYTPGGVWLARTTGINADKLAVNYWRDIFTLNYEVLTLPSGTLPTRTEPSISHWIPSTPTPAPG